MSAAAVLGHTVLAAVVIAAGVFFVALAERRLAVRLGSAQDPPGRQGWLAPLQNTRRSLATADATGGAAVLGWVPGALLAAAVALVPLARDRVAAEAASGSAVLVVVVLVVAVVRAEASNAVRVAGVAVAFCAAVLSFALLAGSLSVSAQVQAWAPWWLIVQAPAALLLLASGLALTARAPFDVVLGARPVHGLALVQARAAQYTGVLLVSTLLAAVYLGGWHGPAAGTLGWLWTVVKTLLVAGALVAVRLRLPRSTIRPLAGRVWSWVVPVAVLQVLLSGTVAALTVGAAS